VFNFPVSGTVIDTEILYSLCLILLQIFRKMRVAASNYKEWKAKNRPEYMPWRFPDQNPLPIVSQCNIQCARFMVHPNKWCGYWVVIVYTVHYS